MSPEISKMRAERDAALEELERLKSKTPVNGTTDFVVGASRGLVEVKVSITASGQPYNLISYMDPAQAENFAEHVWKMAAKAKLQ